MNSKKYKFFLIIEIILLICCSNLYPHEDECTATAININDMEMLMPPESERYFKYGTSVSINANTLVVGSPTYDVAFVFSKNDQDKWEYEAKLYPNIETDYFGYSVSIEKDTIIIGAPGFPLSSLTTGKAFIFTRNNDDEWIHQQMLIPDGTETVRSFGHSVSVSGDTVVIGAPPTNFGTGVAYIFIKNNNGQWSQQAKILPNDIDSVEKFGYSVSIFNDKVLIGAPGFSNNPDYNLDSGAAYVFAINNGQWIQEAMLVADDPTHNAQYGYSVSLDGDICAIGAIYATNFLLSDGAVYVYSHNDNNWFFDAKLNTDWCEYSQFQFGRSVSLSGNNILIGTLGDDCFLYRRQHGIWRKNFKIIDVEGSSSFGSSVSMSGNLLVIGDSGADINGAAYVYKYNPKITWLPYIPLLLLKKETNSNNDFLTR